MSNQPINALLLVNLGTPAAPTPVAVRRYLAEFLGDRRVVPLSPFIWKPILHGMVLPLRGPRSARNYAKIWMPGGSPLAVYTQRLAEAMQQRLPQWRVVAAMRYGEPSMRAALARLHEEGAGKIMVLPLYPQYSTTTTASVIDVVEQDPANGNVACMKDYADDAAWIMAVAASIRIHRETNGPANHLLFSFHGLPQKVADAGDPYPQQCEASARAIAAAAGLSDGDWTLTYQSRFGKERWLEPATRDTLDRLAGCNTGKVDVICPGFAVDCLETLEEIAIGLARRYRERGGELRYIPCLNDSPIHADVLVELVLRQNLEECA
ncbi:MAG: ferrochelatase [Xanthomonadaceae bacterium]|jgi:ferrochelatase|nr:ferrochelatase [Xanthomonadaceae bacterium]